MHSTSLYLATVLIWGSTWFAIKFQLGQVEAEVSLVYRFLLAAIILLIFCLLTRRKLRFSASQHVFIALQGGTQGTHGQAVRGQAGSARHAGGTVSLERSRRGAARLRSRWHRSIKQVRFANRASLRGG